MKKETKHTVGICFTAVSAFLIGINMEKGEPIFVACAAVSFVFSLFIPER